MGVAKTMSTHPKALRSHGRSEDTLNGLYRLRQNMYTYPTALRSHVHNEDNQDIHSLPNTDKQRILTGNRYVRAGSEDTRYDRKILHLCMFCNDNTVVSDVDVSVMTMMIP